jgi:hypothetical protein
MRVPLPIPPCATSHNVDGQTRTVPCECDAMPERLLRFRRHAVELHRYIRNNSRGLINYGLAGRKGQRISTAPAESGMGHLVKERMGRGKPIRWSADGANLLLQVRCAVLDARLDKLFREWYPRFQRTPWTVWTSWTRPHAVGRLRDVPPHDVLWLGTPRCVTRPDNGAILPMKSSKAPQHISTGWRAAARQSRTASVGTSPSSVGSAEWGLGRS